MLIKELSDRTLVSPRLLRYYEDQNLISPHRQDNGYRDYDESLVERVRQIRGLLDIGLTTRIIKEILPCLAGPRTLHFENADPEFVAELESQRDRMNERITFLVKHRDSLNEYLDALRSE